MTAKELLNITANEMVEKIKTHNGLYQFAIERSKFEGWLKVELIDTLLKNKNHAKPEINRIDIKFKNAAIELKTINTNYKFDNVKNKRIPITKNINGVLKDISDLKGKEIENKFVVFIVFPVTEENPKWRVHINKVEKELSELTFKKFNFKDKIPALIYYGKI